MGIINTPLDILAKATKTVPDSIALDCEGRRLNFTEFSELAAEVALFFEKEGVASGDTLPLCVDDSDLFFISMFAAWNMGAVPVPINMSQPEAVRSTIIERAAPRQLITNDGPGPLGLGVSSYEAAQATNDTEPGLILFTSGSTGVPKGVVCTHSMLAGNAQAMAGTMSLNADDRIFISTPAYYTSAICHLLTAFTVGAGVVSRTGFHFGPDLIELMMETGSTGFGGAPAHIIRIADALEECDSDFSPNFIMSSGDHLATQTIKTLRRMLPDTQLYVVYGLSEVGGRLCVLPPQDVDKKIGSVGKPLAGMSVLVIKDDGVEAAPEEQGEVVVSGPLLTPRYFNSPEETRKAMGELGFHTKDIGYKDEDGFLFIEGRMDDIFKSGGEKVSTRMIELALKNTGDFDDVAVLACDDEILGKVPVAFVSLSSGVEFKRPRTVRQLKAILPHTHLPRQIRIMDTIPRTGSGKIIKNELKRTLTNQE